MGIAAENLSDIKPDCDLNAECIKLSGRSDVFSAKSVSFSRNNLILISRKVVKPGTNLIIRFKELPLSKTHKNYEGLRGAGLAEVQWVEEIIDSDGLAYALGVRYIYND